MSRGQFILRRLVQMIPVLLGITLITFLLIQAIPGDPARIMLGTHARPESITALNKQLGLDKPLWQQYGIYLRNLLQLDFGDSIKFKVSVAELLRERLPITALLIGWATLLSIVISLPLGIITALRKDGPFDQFVRATLMITMVMPGFWLGIILLILFSVRFGWFPVSGYGDGFVGHLHHLFLPGLTISLGLAPFLVRALRASILEVMSADYVRTARAKGLGERAVVSLHVLRNALVPTVTLLGLSVGFLIGSTVIVENVFSLPGAGVLLVQAISARDYPLVQSTTLVFAALVIVVNLMTDLVYSFLDPRVRLG
jgi:ABC-type dipeptide/oligopeptide/nickel transport system permease component